MHAKVTFEQSTKLAESLIRGEPNRHKIVATRVADRVREFGVSTANVSPDLVSRCSRLTCNC